MRYTITVQVDEIIKGKAEQTIEVAQETMLGDRRFGEWAEQHNSFLWFFGDNEWSNLGGSNPQWSTIRLGEAVPAEAGWSKDHPAYLMDFAEVTRPEEILVLTRKFAKRFGKKTVKFHTVSTLLLPPTSIRSNTPLWTSLIVPVQPALEEFAREAIRSDDLLRRVEGIKALRHFKSAANIKLLMPFLNDPAFQDWRTEHVVWKTKRSYYSRQAAYDVLQEWGVSTAKPLIQEALPWRFDPSIRQSLDVQIPGRLWLQQRNNGFEMGTDYDGVLNTHVITGSNMITGTRFEWFVHPERQARTATVSRLDLEYWPTPISRVEYFERARDGLPVHSEKYAVEMDFTLFETDKPPSDPDNVPLNTWRPQDGKNYRVLFNQTLKQVADGY